MAIGNSKLKKSLLAILLLPGAACASQTQVRKDKVSAQPVDTRATGNAELVGKPAFSEELESGNQVDEDNAQTSSSRVRKVTVYSDRARVTRRASVDLGSEAKIFAFRKLPGWVDDASVRVATSAGRILNVRVERNFLAHANDESWRRAEKEHKKIQAKLAVLDDETAVLNSQSAQIDAIKAFSLDKISKDTTIGTISVESYGDVLQFISDAKRATAKARREVAEKREILMPEMQASRRRLEELKDLRKLEETTVYVTMQSSQDVIGDLDITYMLPGASWQPKHELRVETDNHKSAELVSYAIVTQTSGEDWSGADIFFSTQSSVQSVKIPELESLTIGTAHRTTRRVRHTRSSFSRAEKAYATQNSLWNKFNSRAVTDRAQVAMESEYQSNFEELQLMQSKTVKIFETLQKRGTTEHYKGMAAATVRGDGRPVRLRIGKSALQSSQRIVAVPEQSLNAARTLEMTNTTKQSLLPGQVALYQDGAFLGMTEIDFIAQGESFSMFVSVADQIKLSRKLDRKHSSILRKRRHRMKLAFNVSVENLSEMKQGVNLADRVPVSENRDIRVSNIRISDGTRPDSQGLLNWELTLKPGETRQLRIQYEVEYPPELILQARRDAQLSPAKGGGATKGRKKIQEQILFFEESL